MSAQYGSEVKRMQHGFAARNGLFAAFLSRGGYTGIEQVFERPYGGFLSVWGNQKRDPPFDASVITKDLGRDWVLRDFCIKPYAAMAGLHPLADCIIEVRRALASWRLSSPVDAQLRQRCPDRLASLDKIKNVHMTFSDAIYGHGGFDCPPPPLAATTAQMCGKYVAAAVLLDGDFHMRQLSAACIDRPELFDLVERISTAHDPAFDAEGMLTSTRVVVTFTDGHVEEVYRRAAHGLDPPLTNAEIVDKFRTFCESVGVSPKRRDAIERLVLGLEDVADVAELVDLLSPEVKNPIA
jgi:aconitate decarboxylase